MSQQKVIQKVTKTDNSFTTNKGGLMFQYKITFEGDAQAYDAYSPNFKFGVGETVEVTSTATKQMPNKIKIEAVGGNTGGYNKGNNSGASKSNYRQDDPNKTKFINYNIVSAAVTENILSEDKLNSENVGKYTAAFLSEINSYLRPDVQDAINIGAVIKRASMMPKCKDAPPSVLVEVVLKMANDMYSNVTGKPYVQNQADPVLEEDFLNSLK